jgi:hypothetical protein
MDARARLPIWVIISIVFLVTMTLYNISLAAPSAWSLLESQRLRDLAQKLLFSSVTSGLAAASLLLYLAVRIRFVLLIAFFLTLLSLLESVFIYFGKPEVWHDLFSGWIPSGIYSFPFIEFSKDELTRLLYDMSSKAVPLAFLAVLYIFAGKWAGKLSHAPSTSA